MKKIFIILTTAVLLVAGACSGSYEDPGTLEKISGGNSGLTGGGVTGTGTPGGGYGGGGSSSTPGVVGTTSGSGGDFTITDIPSQYNGKYAGFVDMSSISSEHAICGAQNMVKGNWVYSQISSESVSIPTWVMEGIGNWRGYNGNSTLKCIVTIYNSANGSTSGVTRYFLSGVPFSSGSATVSWNDGTSF